MHALDFLDARDKSTIGADVVARWARELPVGADVIEIACGGGYPVSRVLVDSGVNLWAIDASPTLLEQFRLRFPNVPTRCSLALESDYFGKEFGAAVAIGLLFLLEEAGQLAFLRRVSEILLPGGRFLFTAPIQTGVWRDTCTGQECRSLGRVRYVQTLEDAGFCLIGTHVDEGQNNYYDVQKISGSGEARHSKPTPDRAPKMRVPS